MDDPGLAAAVSKILNMAADAGLWPAMAFLLAFVLLVLAMRRH